MKVVVEGVFRRRITRKFGPIKSERWQEQRFRWEEQVHPQDALRYDTVLEGLELACELENDNVFVRANIKSRPFVLGDAKIDQPKMTQFSVLSVAGVEISGRVVCTVP